MKSEIGTKGLAFVPKPRRFAGREGDPQDEANQAGACSHGQSAAKFTGARVGWHERPLNLA